VMMEKSLVILLDLSKVLTVEEKDIINQSI
jgi:hypothetical protein